MKKRMAAILLCLFVLLSISAVYAEETGAAADPAVAAAAAEDIIITPAAVQDSKVEIVLSNLTPGAKISFQAFYTAPGGAAEELDYINQYTLDETGKKTINYPTRSTFAVGGTLKIVIGEESLTAAGDGTRTYTFSAMEIKKIEIRSLDN